MLRIIARNALSNFAGFATAALVSFFLTPYVLSSLGESRYGVWMLIVGLSGYYGLLDLGFRSGITQYLTRHLATRDFAEMNRTASTSVAVLSGCGAVVLVASLALAWLVSVIFKLPPDVVPEAQWCILVNGIAMAAEFTFFTFSCVFTATQRYDMANLIAIILRLISAAATIIALRLGYGLVGLSVVIAATELLGYGLRWRLAYRLLPELRISLRSANSRSFRELVSFGGWAFLISISGSIFSYTNAVIIGVMMPAAAIARYALGANLIPRLQEMFASLSQVMFPAATHLHARGDFEELGKLYLRGSRLLLAVVLNTLVIAAVWAEDFYHLWLRAAYPSDPSLPDVSLLCRILLLGSACTYFSNVGGQILLGSGRIKALAVMTISEAIVRLLLSIGLLYFYGLVGIAVASVPPAFLVRVVLMPIVVGRVVGVSARRYFWESSLRPLTAAWLLGGLCIVIRHAVGDVGWRGLCIQGLAAGGCAALLTFALCLDTVERRRLLAYLFAGMRARFAHRTGENPQDVE